MALSLFMANEGLTPGSIETTATVSFDNVNGAWTVTSSHLLPHFAAPQHQNNDGRHARLAAASQHTFQIGVAVRPSPSVGAAAVTVDGPEKRGGAVIAFCHELRVCGTEAPEHGNSPK